MEGKERSRKSAEARMNEESGKSAWTKRKEERKRSVQINEGRKKSSGFSHPLDDMIITRPS